MKVYIADIITCDKKDSVNKYLVTDKDRIVYVGDSLPKKYSRCDMMELAGHSIVPAFVDTHIHFASFALFNSGLNVGGYKSNQDVLSAIKNFSKTNRSKILIAFGSSAHSVKEKTLLCRDELDTVTGDKPTVVVKYDGHALIANSALIKQIPDEIKAIRGYDAQSGEMSQEAFFKVVDMLTASLSTIDLIKNMFSAVDFVAKKGIGMFHTVTGIGFAKDLDVTLETMLAKGIKGMQARVFFQTMDVDKALKRKLPRIGGCFETALDGCFGSMDAAINLPYENTDNKGILFSSDDDVIAFCKRANREGLQIELHAIGDAAFDQACMALSEALADFPRKDHRHTIIHACMPTQSGIEICANNGIMLAMQSAFIDWPLEPKEYLVDILGERANNINPIKTFFDQNIKISLSSDGPCTSPDPLLWVHNVVNNSEESQQLGVLDALKMATYNGCLQSFDEKEYGSLEVGKKANFVILAENPLEIEKEKIKDITVKALYTDGSIYKKQSKSIIGMIIKAMIKPNKF
jgi:predicted amidohydrolase YtcJ